MAGVAALELLAAWLGAGRLVASAGDLGDAALLDHVDALCAIRSSRRWSGLITMRMLVSVHVGRSAWLTRSLRVSLVAQRESIEAHAALQTRHDHEIERSRAVEDRLLDRIYEAQRRVEELEEELEEREEEFEGLQGRFQDMSDHAQELEFELYTLRNAPRAE
jgi:uncharacterized protein YlxW (UPF0749 family)